MRIIVLYGPPCAGKSALAKELHAELGYVSLSTDALRISYFDELGESYNSDSVSEIYNMLFERIEKYAEAGKSVIVEGMFLTDKNKERVLQFSKSSQIIFVYVTASFKVLTDRLNRRSKKESNNILQHEVPLSIDSLLLFYNSSKPPKSMSIAIDTSDNDITASYLELRQIISREYPVEYLKMNILNGTNSS